MPRQKRAVLGGFVKGAEKWTYENQHITKRCFYSPNTTCANDCRRGGPPCPPGDLQAGSHRGLPLRRG